MNGSAFPDIARADSREAPAGTRNPERGAAIGVGAGWSLRRRLEWVARFRKLVLAEMRTLTDLICEEVHKARFEAEMGDVAVLLAACRWHEKHAGRVLRGRGVLGRSLVSLGQRHRTCRLPLGRVAIIATWNYPVQLLGVQLLQALVAGNRVVVKPSEHAPRTQALLLEIAHRAGADERTLSWTEPTREAGRALLERERFDHVVFTGSTFVGESIARHLADSLTTSTLELSGRDSAIVLGDADVQLAAKSIWAGVTSNGGQTCIAPRRALVCERVYQAFLKELGALAGSAKPRTLIDERAAQHVFALAEEAVAMGGRSVSGVLERPVGAQIRPIAIADCDPACGLVGGDHFGPALAVVRVRDEAEAVRIHRGIDQHLSCSVFTRRPSAHRGLVGELVARSVMFNDCVMPVGHPGASLGGVGASGWGSSRGQAGLLELTRCVHVSVTSARVRPPTGEPSGSSRRRLLSVVKRVYG